MLDLSYQPKEKPQKMKGSQALSMQNVVNNAIMTRQGGQAPQGNTTMTKTDGFGRSV